MKTQRNKGFYDEIIPLLSTLYEKIHSASAILILGHQNPDGDCLCSMLALAKYIQSVGKRCFVVGNEDFPDSFGFLPHQDYYQSLTQITLQSSDYDTVIVVDSGDVSRLGQTVDLITDTHYVVNIDHHISNSLFGSLNIVLTRASSIGEILYYFFHENGIDIDFELGLYLYISIVTDTGSFRYDSMHAGVHRIAAELLDLGIRPMDYNQYLYQNKKKSTIWLLSKALAKIEFFYEDRIVLSVLLYEDFVEAGGEDTEGIIENIGSIEGVSVYVLIKEKEKGVFMASMRSKFSVDVALVAASFGGGGHKRASGCKTSKMTLPEFKNKIIKQLAQQL